MWLWRAFNRLSTTRPRGFGQGPISYREVMLYGDELGIGDDQREFLWEVVRKVDAQFLKLIAEKTKAETSKHRPRK